MAIVRHLENAPITEAIIDFRVKSVTGFQVESFLSLKSQLETRFPQMEQRLMVESRLQIHSGQIVSQSTKPGELQGYWFKSPDGLDIAQFRKDGFTFNRLKPYTSWEKVFPDAWDLWQMYVSTGVAEFVTRIAVRFVNRLPLPLPIGDLGQYLTAPPRIPAGIPGRFGSFLSRVVLQDAYEQGLAANITQALEKDVDPRNIMIILDIDTYKRKEFEVQDESLKVIFCALRDFKNCIFFGSITEDTARLFE